MRAGRLKSLTERAEDYARVGNWSQEAGAVNAAILKLDPENVAAHTRLAKWCLERGRGADAEKLYRRPLQLDPANRIARNCLAEIVRQRRHDTIVAELSTFDQLFHRGVEERRKGHLDLAATLLEKAEALASSDAARIALAGAYRDLQRLARAETIYRSILRRRENRAAQVGLAAVLRDKGELYEAESLCREVLKRYPGDQHAQQTLWAIQADMRKPAWRR